MWPIYTPIPTAGKTRMNLTEFAHEAGKQATAALSRLEQKTLGQFMTPPEVATFMAARCLPEEDVPLVKILDPAAGTGILVAAVVERLLARDCRPETIQVTLFELDGRLCPTLRKLATRMRKSAKQRGVTLSVSIRQEDFLISDIATTGAPIMDVIIANPPYFKLRATDARAKAHRHVVFGQPNIYGLFMATSANLIGDGGKWCFITPRSWTNGVYFKAVRRHLLRHLHLDAMHVFGSRRDHFTDDVVLQEAMITWATAQATPLAEIIISSSEGSRDIGEAQLNRLSLEDVIGHDDTRVITLPVESSLSMPGHWHETIESLGLRVCTGPVVAFRAEKHLGERPVRGSAPLLWMQHIERMRVRWPIDKKREHIASNGETAWMLVPNMNLVVLRRFSPKEDERRVTAAPYFSNALPGPVLGLENHTNYIHRPGAAMTADEVRGLAAYLNCHWVDAYFRSKAGNTQINASDLRRLPLPPRDHLIAIGRTIGDRADLAAIDAAVDGVLGSRGNGIMAA